MRNLILIICAIFVIENLFCQKEIKIEIKQDSVKTKIPFKAAVLSFFLPGGGQFYNESYWKAGGVLALEGSLIGLTVYHHFKSEDYKNKFDDSNSQLYYNEYVKFYNKRQSDLWWLGTVIFLSTINAYVDAHLYDFDEKKNKIHLKFEDNMLSLQYDF